MSKEIMMRCCVCGRCKEETGMWFYDTKTEKVYCPNCGFDELARRMEEAGE